LWFAAAGRALNTTAVGHGLVPVAFRSPPRDPALDRSLRRRADGTVVSVRVGGRARSAVWADMVDGVLTANDLGPGERSRLRRDLLAVADSVAA
jgi:hypothetical protein